MIRLFCLIISASIVLIVANFLLKEMPKNKKWTIFGGGIAGAAIGIWMQSAFSLYLALLSIIAVSLIAALIYKKQMEKEQIDKLRLEEERKSRREKLIQAAVAQEPEAEVNLVEQPETVKQQETIDKLETSNEISSDEKADPALESVAVKSFGMQKIQSLGKGR